MPVPPTSISAATITSQAMPIEMRMPVRIVGAAAAIVLFPTRLKMPAALFGAGLFTFAMVGLGGLSVIDRYLLVPSLMLMLLAAVAIAGWTMLTPGTWLRRGWMAVSLVLVVFGVAFTADRVNINRLENELVFRGEWRTALREVLDDPAVQAGLSCGPVFVPNHKLVPDVRWDLDLPADQVIARTDPNDPGSILHHGVPAGMMINTYGCDDIDWLAKNTGQPNTITVQAHGRTYYLPFAAFENTVDKTSFLRDEPNSWDPQKVKAVHDGLSEALQRIPVALK